MKKIGIILLMLIAISLICFEIPKVKTETITLYKYDNAVSGRYYILKNMYDVFYISSSGNRYWVTTYKWDANTTYMIFQSPVSGILYFLPSSSVKPTLSTGAWFNPSTPPYPKAILCYPYPFSINVTLNLYSTASYQPSSVTYDGIKVNATFQVTATPLSSTYYEAVFDVPKDGLEYITRGVWYTTNIEYKNFPSAWSKSISQLCKATWINSGGTLTTASDTWVFKHTTDNRVYIPTGSCSYDNSNPTQAKFYVATGSGGYYGTTPKDYWKITISIGGGQTTYYTSVLYYFSNYILNCPNGNTIENLTGRLSAIQIPFQFTQLSFNLYTTVLNVDVDDDASMGIIVKFDTSSSQFNHLNKINALAYIEEINAFYNIAIYGFRTEKTYVVIPCSLSKGSYTVNIIWSFPFVDSEPENITKIEYDYQDLLTLLPIQGNLTVSDENKLFIVDGIVSLYYFENKLIQIDADITYYEGEKEVRSFYINDEQFYYPRSELINGTTIMRGITEYKTMTLFSPVNTTTTVVEVYSLKQYSITLISLALGLYRGTWGYRIPVYINFNEIPFRRNLIFRLKLPLGSYIRQSLISPALEDFLITDINNKPLPYLVAYWQDVDYAVVYVKYPELVSTPTLTLYLYLNNKVLWNTGNSYQSLSTWDLIDPVDITFKDHVNNFTCMPTYSVYNYFVFKNYDKILFASTLVDGIVLDPRNGKLVEYHGTYRREISISPIVSANELNVLLDGTKINVYADNVPQACIDLNDVFPENVEKSINFVGWSGTNVYVGSTTYYTYTLGNIMGGQIQAPKTSITNPYSSQKPQIANLDFWSIAPMLFILIVLALVMRVMKGGISKGDMLSKI
jgi:hypothetical protein